MSLRRNLGVLLAAEEDDEVWAKVKQTLFVADPRLKAYIENPAKGQGLEIDVLKGSPYGIEGQKRQIIAIFATYIFCRDDCFVSEDIFLYKSGEHYISTLLNIEKGNIQIAKTKLDRAQVLDMLKLDKKEWEFLRSFTSSDIISKLKFDQTTWLKKENLPKQVPELDHQLSADEREEVFVQVGVLWDILISLDIGWADMFVGRVISREEQNQILLRLCLHTLNKSGVRPHHYISAFVTYILGKEIQSMRQFYWAHNEETQYLEQHRLQRENERLLKENFSLQKQVELMQAEVAKQRKDNQSIGIELLRPFKEELTSLKCKIIEQEAELAAKQEDIKELYALRQLLLAEKEQDFVPDACDKLSCAAEKRKVVFIGGHINLRNKLKAAHPYIEVVDGTNPSFDSKLLDNADIVVFYTHNMSHAVYEKAVSIVRQNYTPYGYISRATSLDLIEQEIVRLLKAKTDELEGLS